VITAVPALTPVTTPELLTVACEQLLLHVPPDTDSVNVMVADPQALTEDAPDIVPAEVVLLTVTV
jgi:hypothetical protein